MGGLDGLRWCRHLGGGYPQAENEGEVLLRAKWSGKAGLYWFQRIHSFTHILVGASPAVSHLGEPDGLVEGPRCLSPPLELRVLPPLDEGAEVLEVPEDQPTVVPWQALTLLVHCLASLDVDVALGACEAEDWLRIVPVEVVEERRQLLEGVLRSPRIERLDC